MVALPLPVALAKTTVRLEIQPTEQETRIVELELEEMSLIEQAQEQGLDVLPRALLEPARVALPRADARAAANDGGGGIGELLRRVLLSFLAPVAQCAGGGNNSA